MRELMKMFQKDSQWRHNPDGQERQARATQNSRDGDEDVRERWDASVGRAVARTCGGTREV